MKGIYSIIFLLSILPALSLKGQEINPKQSTQISSQLNAIDEEEEKPLINDYSMIGVNYGLNFSGMMYNPDKIYTERLLQANYISLMYTKYSKMFDYLPYFGLSLGFAYAKEGFAFSPDPKTGEYTQHIDGATRGSIQCFEFPAYMQIHYDIDPVKIMANLGVYGGYRLSIERTGPEGLFNKEYAQQFRSYENRIDYGLQGGAGLAIMLDPIEIHFNCLVRWAWSSLYEPDYYSQYYYRYAYPFDFIATVGIHFQLQKRSGKTSADLRKEAYNRVYGKTSNNTGKDR